MCNLHMQFKMETNSMCVSYMRIYYIRVYRKHIYCVDRIHIYMFFLKRIYDADALSGRVRLDMCVYACVWECGCVCICVYVSYIYTYTIYTSSVSCNYNFEF